MNDYITNAFTKKGENTNLEVDNLNVSCITSKNNNFELDSNGNLTVQSIITENQNIETEAMRDFVYPVGSIYMSVSEVNPSTLFGGTWEQIKDKFLLSCGDSYQNGTTGGEESHVLTKNEIPSHNHSASTNKTGGHRHSFKGWWTTKGDGTATYACIARTTQKDSAEYGSFSTEGAHSHSVTINSTGDGQAHNNMPPYLAVYMWKRIS